MGRETVDTKMNQVELIEKKMTLSEMEILLDGINKKFDITEEKKSVKFLN